MKLKVQKPSQSLNKAFLKQRPLRGEINLFKENLIRLLGKVDEIEHEENQKNHVRDFLLDTFFKETNEINTKDRKDLVIHLGKNSKDKVGVIIEAKRPSNIGEMLSANHPNSKAIQELILYYLDERNKENNNELKQLIVTNIYEWFIIDANYFDKWIYGNSKIKKLYEVYLNDKKSTSFFYDEISKIIPTVECEISCTYFDIRHYEKYLKNKDKEEDKNLIALFKIFSPYNLLKVPLTNDSNELNENFYKELLYIIGLEEAKEGSKTIIRRRKENSIAASILEMAIHKLKTKGIHKLPDIRSFGENSEEQYFNIGLELCITWVNRILFLKLLEGQLISYHKGDKKYSFLNTPTIFDFEELFKLFHEVLAVKVSEREHSIQEKYKHVPYLNSSLFEISELEDLTISIDSLDNSEPFDLINTTILKEHKRRNEKLKTLDYLLQFLDSYDFSSEGTEDIQEDNRTLINASVLGKVFEKINSFKDGSIYTPGFITMFMSREAIRLAVVQKFNDTKKWEIKGFDELYNKIEDINEANSVINSLKICDPAVGSGHFLVSALNEIIAIKSELKILKDKHGKRLKEYTVEVINDELIITDEDGEIFEYTPHNKESQRLQESLFIEKQTIIENCLFGVDINPNSVKICRLRLWIELLKNAYYKESTNYEELETLPNIDINIKCGNSLLSRFSLDSDLSKALKSIKYDVSAYRGFVNEYKNEKNREVKKGLQKVIDTIKSDFRTEIYNNDPKFIALNKKSGELYNLLNQKKIFDENSKQKKAEKAKQLKLESEIRKLTYDIDQIRTNAIYKNAFEWRFEFPEVLTNDGDFDGFDIVIANPPYIRQEEIFTIKQYLKDNYNVFVAGGDIFSYFYELSYNLLKENGKFAFINNTFDKTTAGKVLRKFVSEEFHIKKYIDFTSVTVFHEVTTYPVILIAEKDKNRDTFQYFKFTKENFKNKSLIEHSENFIESSQSLLDNVVWNFLDEVGAKILNRIKQHKPLSEIYGKCNRGIVTGFNPAFIIDNPDVYNDIIKESPKDIEIIKPILEGSDIKKWNTSIIKKWVIFTRRGTDIDKYPAVKRHLEKYKNELTPKKNKSEKVGRKPGTYKWFEIQDVVGYYMNFEKNKIMSPNLQNQNRFCFDNENRYINAPSVILPTNDKFLLSVLNSKVVWYFLKNICVLRNGGYIEVKPQYFEQIPVPQIEKEEARPFEILVDYLIYLSDIHIEPISENVPNEHIVKFFEDINNGCVYELYFREHMREKGIDILGFVKSQIPPIAHLANENEKRNIISKTYKTLREPDNVIRNRMLLFGTRSPEIILPLIKST